jgi:hypothetical protein
MGRISLMFLRLFTIELHYQRSSPTDFNTSLKNRSQGGYNTHPSPASQVNAAL